MYNISKLRIYWSSRPCSSYFFSANICTQGGDKGFCDKDWGGSLLIQENNRFAAVGVASWAVRDACPIETQGYVYARVTARKQWILDNTNGTQESNCTIDIEPALKSNTDEDSLPVELIAGVSAAALVLAAIIIA